MVRFLSRIFGLVLLFSIAGLGCSNFGSMSSTSSLTSISGVVQLGLVDNATVKAYCLDADGQRQSQPLGTATSDSQGQFTIRLLQHSNCSVLMIAGGGSYQEEADGSTVALGASDEVRSILEMKNADSDSVEISITPVSEMAVARFENLRDALQTVGGTTASHEELGKVIERAKEEIRESVGLPQGIDVTRVIPAPPTRPDSDANSSKNQMTAVIAGLSNMAGSQGKNSFQLAALRATDAADGSIAATYWLDLPHQISSWAAGAHNSGGFTPPTSLTLVTNPAVDLSKYPLPSADLIRNVPFRLAINAAAAQATAACVGPFGVGILNLNNEPTPAQTGLLLNAVAANQSAQTLEVYSSSADREAGSGALAAPATLSSIYVRFGSGRPTKVYLTLSAVASAVLPTSLVHNIAAVVVPPSETPDIHMVSVYQSGSVSTGWTMGPGGVLIPPVHNDGHATVAVAAGTTPIILLLTSYEGDIWTITAGNWIYDMAKTQAKLLALKVQELTGGVVTSMQGQYDGINFTVGDGLHSAPALPAQSTTTAWVYAEAIGGYDHIDLYEAGGGLNANLYASNPGHGGIYVNIVLEHITTNDNDIAAFTRTVYIAPGATRTMFSFPFIRDTVSEGGSESFRLRFSIQSGASQVVTPTLVGTIHD